MSITSVPQKTRYILWGKASGRCEYKGCNEILFRDPTTKVEFNEAYVAHIIADSPDGPRGHATLSVKLKSDISNLMLLCDRHHRLIDVEDVASHPDELLKKMKEEHELRIELQTSVHEDMQSQILFYGANIGSHTSPLNIKDAKSALFPNKYPASHYAIEIGFKNNATTDETELYWTQEVTNLRTHFTNKVKNLIESGEINHISVFSLAPQPLLIELGRLLGDISKVTTHQKRREPNTWKWSNEEHPVEYKVLRPHENFKKVALNLSLSAFISNERIIKTLGEDTAIWTLTLDNPHNDFLHSTNQLSEFRKTMRKLLNEIKHTHGHDTELSIFPATPNSIAIECGRVWMPKADMPLNIYEENRSRDGFFKAHTIKHL